MADIRAGLRAVDGKLVVLAVVTGIAWTIGSFIAHRTIKAARSEVSELSTEDATSE